jgi:hypothetical protein
MEEISLIDPSTFIETPSEYDVETTINQRLPKKRKIGVRENIFKDSTTGSGYSSLSFHKVKDFLDLDRPGNDFFGRDDKNTVEDLEVTEETLEFVSKYLIKVTRAEGNASSGLESKRNDFVSPILINVIDENIDKNIKLFKEEQIKGEFVGGPIEYVVKNDKKIIVIVESKASDTDQGRAQNLMQVYNAYILNLNNKAPDSHVVYGIITTGFIWEIISLTKEDNRLLWKHKQQFMPIETDTNKNIEEWKSKIKPLLGYINYMINNAVSKLN